MAEKKVPIKVTIESFGSSLLETLETVDSATLATSSTNPPPPPLAPLPHFGLTKVNFKIGQLVVYFGES